MMLERLLDSNFISGHSIYDFKQISILIKNTAPTLICLAESGLSYWCPPAKLQLHTAASLGPPDTHTC